jgi:DNA-binding PadR family transcriptional regulator
MLTPVDIAISNIESDPRGRQCSDWKKERLVEFCVLGLLMMRDMTIYQLNRSFETSLSLFYSASLGSLQVALKKLISKNLVTCREDLTGPRRRKTYSLEASGREAFLSAMFSDIPPNKLEVTALSRLFFLGLLPDQAMRESILARIVAAIREALCGLERAEAGLESLAIPADFRGIFRYQKKTMGYGVMAHRAALSWFESVLEEERAGNR